MTPEQKAFWTAFCAATGRSGEPSAIVSFGITPEQEDLLAQLVLTGPKRATAGPMWDYEFSDEPVPKVGDLVLFHWSDKRPAGIWESTDIRIGPLSSVDDAFAWDEGEGDRSRDFWLRMHIEYFQHEAKRYGVEYHDDVACVFERFKLVWPPEHADPAG